MIYEITRQLQGMARRLAAADPAVLHAEDRPERGARGEGRVGAGVPGGHPAEVIAEALPEALIVEGQLPLRLRPEALAGPAPGRNPVGLDVVEGGEDPLPRRQSQWNTSSMPAHHSPSARESRGRWQGLQSFHHSWVIGSAAIFAMSASKS